MNRYLLYALAAWLFPACALLVAIAIAVARDRGIADLPDDPEPELLPDDRLDLGLIETDPAWIDRLVQL